MKEFKEIVLPEDNTVKITNSWTNQELWVTERQLRYLQVEVAKGEIDPYCFMIESRVYHDDIGTYIPEPIYLFNSGGSFNQDIYNIDFEEVLHQCSNLTLEYIQLKRSK